MVGAVLGGLCLGLAMGAPALIVGDRHGAARAGVVLAAAALAIASDARAEELSVIEWGRLAGATAADDDGGE